MIRIGQTELGPFARRGVWLCVWLSACGTRSSLHGLPAQVVEHAKQGDVTDQTVAAANALLATLDEAERAKIALPFETSLKTKWSNFPSPMYGRNGIRVGDLSSSQRESVMRLLGVALSREGMQQVREIMEGDEVQKAAAAGHKGPPGGGPGMGPPGGDPGRRPPGGGPGGPMREPSFGRDEYYLAFLGTPSTVEPWMLQFGGHHLAINVTIVGKDETLTPSLPCAQPASYKLEGQTVRPLGREHDKSLSLVRSLDEAEKQKAILPYQVSDLVLGPGQDGKTIVPEGIRASELNDAQRRMLLDLAHEWVGILNDEAANVKMADVEAHLAETWFAWSGPLDEGPAYFRIQGPTLLIEYSPQRSRGAGLDADHIHTIYRDPTNDYGARWVKR